MELTIKNLENCFNGALENNANYLGIKVQFEDRFFCCQIIINDRNNFNLGLDYYKKTYNEKLIDKNNVKVKIVGFTYGKTFEDIERDLMN